MKAALAVVCPVPPLAIATVPVTFDAVPVVFWLKVGKEVRDAADPVGDNTSVPITKPRLVLAPEASDAPVPPSATAKSVIPVILPPVMDTLFAAWVAIVPKPPISAVVRVTAPVLPATEVTKLVWSSFCQTVPLNIAQSPTCQSVTPFRLVEPAVETT